MKRRSDDVLNWSRYVGDVKLTSFM